MKTLLLIMAGILMVLALILSWRGLYDQATFGMTIVIVALIVCLHLDGVEI